MAVNLQTALKFKNRFPAIWASNNKEMAILLGFRSKEHMMGEGFKSAEDYYEFLSNTWCTEKYTPGKLDDYLEYKRSKNVTSEAVALRYIQSVFIQLHGLSSPSCNKELILLNRAFADPTPVMCKKAVEQYNKYMQSFHEELEYYKLTGEFIDRTADMNEPTMSIVEESKEVEEDTSVYDIMFNFCLFVLILAVSVYMTYPILRPLNKDV
jgi:hypothetical protein